MKKAITFLATAVALVISTSTAFGGSVMPSDPQGQKKEDIELVPAKDAQDPPAKTASENTGKSRFRIYNATYVPEHGIPDGFGYSRSEFAKMYGREQDIVSSDRGFVPVTPTTLARVRAAKKLCPDEDLYPDEEDFERRRKRDALLGLKDPYWTSASDISLTYEEDEVAGAVNLFNVRLGGGQRTITLKVNGTIQLLDADGDTIVGACPVELRVVIPVSMDIDVDVTRQIFKFLTLHGDVLEIHKSKNPDIPGNLRKLLRAYANACYDELFSKLGRPR